MGIKAIVLLLGGGPNQSLVAECESAGLKLDRPFFVSFLEIRQSGSMGLGLTSEILVKVP